MSAPRYFFLRYLDFLGAAFDFVHGVETRGRTPLRKLNFGNRNKGLGSEYEPVPVPLFPMMLSVLPDDLSSFTFVDYGSGKGRALLLASHWNFKKIIGVEFSPELHRLALRNVSRYRGRNRKCFDIEPRCVDAADFEIPAGDCVLFFYNPFSLELMAKVAEAIVASFQAAPRQLYIIYYNPVARAAFDRFPLFQPCRVDEEHGLRSLPFDLAVFRTGCQGGPVRSTLLEGLTRRARPPCS